MKKFFIIILTSLTFLLSAFTEKSNTSEKVLFGIDVSHYQGNIDYKSVKKSKHNIRFVIIRSTMGAARIDANFTKNFKDAKKNGFLVGAYHYYDPNESSILQAKHYLAVTNLKSGNIIPIVDLENLSTCQSTESLKNGLRKWLKIVEKSCGTKPIIYSGLSYYKKYLAEDFKDYPYWIASYSSRSSKSDVVKNAAIHQFSDKMKVAGIKGKVDGNKMKSQKVGSLVLK